MRVTERGMSRTVLNDLMANRGRLSRIQEQMSSGSRINRPSDDPGGTVTLMRVTSSLSEIDQYQSNISLGRERLNSTEAVLAEASDAVNRLRELAVRGATGSMPDASLNALGQEVSEIFEHLLSLGNTEHVGRYLFSGNQTDTRPFEVDPTGGILYHGDEADMTRRIGPGIEVPLNINGEATFRDVLESAASIRDALFAGEQGQVDQSLDALDGAQDTLLDERSQVGSRMNRLDMSENRLEDLKISLTRVLSETGDVDMAEAIMDLNLTERAYQVALATGARILPQTLLDFLR